MLKKSHVEGKLRGLDQEERKSTRSQNKGTQEELRAGLRTLDERHISERMNINYFEARYQIRPAQIRGWIFSKRNRCSKGCENNL